MILLERWQTLIGAALGPFLAIVFSVLGYWIKGVVVSKRERREELRRIEIGTTRSLEDILRARVKLSDFVSRLRMLIKNLRGAVDDSLSFESVNFPPMREIYRDVDAASFRVTSYYLHNKTLWVDASIKEMNEIIRSLRSGLAELERKNELHIILLRQNITPNAAIQRAAYAKNLDFFGNEIERFVNEHIKQFIEMVVQVKVYNNSLRKRGALFFRWRHEGTRFKFFRNKTEQGRFARNLISLDRIDQAIQKEVKEEIDAAETRAAGLLKK